MKTNETPRPHLTDRANLVRADRLRQEADAAHPAIAHALRRRAAEIEMQSWLEEVAEGSTTTVDGALAATHAAAPLAA